MTVQANSALQAFQWAPQPDAWNFLRSLADDFLSSCPDAKTLAERMADETGTRFVDWIDHVRLPRRDARARQLSDVGYQAETNGPGYTVFANDNGMFPPVLVWDGTFEIANVPAGVPLEFRVWHEAFKYVGNVSMNGSELKTPKGTIKQTLNPGETVGWNLEFDAALLSK